MKFLIWFLVFTSTAFGEVTSINRLQNGQINLFTRNGASQKLYGNIPTQQRFTSGSGTYITPPGVIYLKIRMVGGGGGGGGSTTTNTATTGGTGGTTTFGSSLLTCVGGTGGNNAANNGAGGGGGGTATIASPAYGLTITGSSGQVGSQPAAFSIGALGGQSAFFGGLTSDAVGAVGGSGVTNSGSGGAGGGAGNASIYSGSGGGAGASIDAIIPYPISASYAFSVGAAGTAGTASGANTFNGGAGGSGFIVVDEFYQ